MTKQYCVKRYREQDGKVYYRNISPNIKTVQMCVDKNEKIYEIDISETNEIVGDTYYGWRNDKGNISFIYPVITLVDICFPYGYKAEEDSGKGKLVVVKIEEIREVKL